jgi:hypothetical protein
MSSAESDSDFSMHEKDSDFLPELISMGAIEQHFNLTAADIKVLPFKLCGTPRERHYHLHHVKKIADEMTPETRKRQLEVEERQNRARLEKRRKKVVEAKLAVQQFKFDQHTMKTGSMRLPLELLHPIVERIINSFDIELDDLSVIVNQVAQLALSCPDLLIAAKHGFELITKRFVTVRLPAGIDWDKLVENPTAFKVVELKEACSAMDLPVSGTKAGMIV